MAFDPETGQDTPDNSGEMLRSMLGMSGNDADMFGEAFNALGKDGLYNGKVIDGKIYASGRGENINVTARTQQAVGFFQTQDGGGWTKQQSIGIVANLVKESGLKTDIAGDFTTGGSYGLAQWHADRRAVYAKEFGHRMDDPSLTSEQRFSEQLKFVNYELNHSEHVAGDALRNATSAGEAAATFTAKYERPADVDKDMAVRAAAARGIETKLDAMAVANAAPTMNPTNANHAIIKAETVQAVSNGVPIAPAAPAADNDNAPKPSKSPDEEKKQEASKVTGKPAQSGAQIAANASFPVPKGPLSNTF